MGFDRAFEETIGLEGGFSRDPDDNGNWTGGRKGLGKLKGTKYGISAAQYPSLDIESLTLHGAKEICRRDYWSPLRLDYVESEPIREEIRGQYGQGDCCPNCTKVHKLSGNR